MTTPQHQTPLVMQIFPGSTSQLDSKHTTATQPTGSEGESLTIEEKTTNSSVVPDEVDEPPNGGYGWICAVAVAVMNAHSWGFNSAYAVFLAYYLDHGIFKGASRIEYAFVGSLSLTATFLVSPLATFATQRYGIRPTMFAGVLCEAVSLICASFANRIWQLFLTQGVLFGIGLGLMFIPATNVVPQWFTTKRSLAAGIAVSGAGLGGFIYNLVAEALIQGVGFAWAFRILGIIAIVVNTACVILVKDRKGRSKLKNIDMDVTLFKDEGFLLLIGYSVLTIFGYFILIFSLAHYGTSIGLSPSQASLVSGLFNLGQAFGRPASGYFSDKAGRINIAGVSTFLAGVICLAVWVNARSYGLLIFFALAAGLTAGNFWAAIAPLVAQVCGLSKVSAGMNLVWLSIIIPSTFSEPIALQLTTVTGKYLGAQLFAGFMYVAASICLGILRLRKRSR